MSNDQQLSIDGQKVVDKDMILLKYEGPSFENKMELHHFTRQITAVERMLRDTIDTLNRSQKINGNSRQSKYYLELRKGSFETALLILFANPILINVLSDCIFEYLKYLVSGKNESKYNQEIRNLVGNKNIRKYTRDILGPCVTGNDKVTLVHNGDINYNLVINNEKKEKIQENLLKVEDELPIEEYEQELFGSILKVDAVKAQENLNKSKIGFVMDRQAQPIEAHFETEISEDQLRSILFLRIKIKAITYHKSGDIIRVLIKSYELAPIKKLDSYFN